MGRTTATTSMITVYKDIVAFVFLIVVLLIRPGGFMRHKV